MSGITGTGGNDNLNGGAGDDVMNGGAGNDQMSGGAGNDIMDGGTGNDQLNGGSGNDILNGGSGNDVLNGDSGNDTLIYTLAENGGATDVYTGGSGIDTVRLQLTAAEWVRADVQAQIAAYLQHLATVKVNQNSGEVSNGSASDFTFVFSGGTRLTVQMMEKLDVWVDGQPFDFHAPFIAAADGAGAVTEDGANPTLSDSGTINFLDVDWSQTQTASASPCSGNPLGGTLTASVTNAATGDGSGVVTWSYSVANSVTQYLGAGETAVETFKVTITDSSGKKSVQTITVTVTGTNDAPVLTVDQSGGVTEDANGATLTDTGTLSFTDVDVNDLHSVSTSYNGDASWSGGSLTAAEVAAVTSGFSADSNSWDYSMANNALNFLAAGETITLSFTVTVTDDSGAGNNSDSKVVTLTLTGSNDAPVVTGAVLSTVDEDDANPATVNLLANASDPDRTDDVDTASVAYSVSAGTWAPAVSYSVDNETGALTLDPHQFNALGANESIQLTFTYNVVDGNGGVTPTTAVLTVTGSNDAPILNAAVSPLIGDVDENAGAPVGAVGTLVSDLVNLNPPSGGLDNVTDADHSATTGVAITGADGSNGTWWYTTDNGAHWTQFDPVSDSSALLLAADSGTRVYFQGDSNFSGTVDDALTYRAWDRTSGTAGNYANTTVNGGSTAFSSATDSVDITVNSANEDPVVVGDRIIVSNSTTVTIPVSALLGNDTDIDGLELAITGVGNAAGISGLTLNPDGTITFTSGATAGATAGSFTYTVADGAGGTSTGTVTIDIRATGNNADTINLGSAGTYQASYLDGRGNGDNFTGGAPGDIFVGGLGADMLTGGAGNDLLIGGDNNDTLDGGAGNDVLRGGIGNTDTMNGGAGTEDLLDFSDGTSAVTFTLVQSSGSTAITNGTGGLGNNDTYMNMEGVIGTSLGDNLTGSAGNDILRGGGGNDTLNGAGGSDLLDFSDGAAGINFTLVNNGSGTVFNSGAAGLGTDTYSGFEGVIGTAYDDTLTGSASADQLRGGEGSDVIAGLAGDDRIVGGGGADTLTGGADNDTFVFNSAPNAVDTITDFNASESAASEDIIELSLATFTALTTTAGNTLSASEFASANGTGADDTFAAGVHVIYDSATGNLYYDSDGGSSANRTLIATITQTNPSDTLDFNDIRVGT